jgi:hypothetical protein
MSRRVVALVGIVVLTMMILLVQISTGHRAPAEMSVVKAVAIQRSPTTLPIAATTQPTGNSALPDEFAVLTTHSPFGHGRHAAAGGEDSIVFKGVMQTNDHFVAFLEDTSSKNVIQANVGDAIAQGKIKSVDLDSIEYEATGKSLRVQVGQNLMGQVPSPPPAPAPPPAGPPSDGAPPGPPSPDQTDGQPMPPQGPPKHSARK